jgi:RNA polymerase sigma-70 factor (ECF subfamily)
MMALQRKPLSSDEVPAGHDPGEARGPDGTAALDVPSLVARAADGDVAAFERLVAAYQPKVYSFAFTFTGSPDEARDLAQEALIKVYRSIGSFRFQSSFTTWLFSVVRNTFLDAYKSRAARERARETSLDGEAYHLRDALSEAALAEERLLRQDERRALWRALRRVPTAYRTVVVMFDVQGLSYDEIAQVLKVPVGTVKSRLKRGRDALRVELFRIPELCEARGAAAAGGRRSEVP